MLTLNKVLAYWTWQQIRFLFSTVVPFFSTVISKLRSQAQRFKSGRQTAPPLWREMIPDMD
jgi:hypothetical protein